MPTRISPGDRENPEVGRNSGKHDYPTSGILFRNRCYGVANTVGFRANYSDDIRGNGSLVRGPQEELFDTVIAEYRHNL